MSTLALELGAELENFDPEDAQHIQRAVREMLQLVKRKPKVATPTKPYVTEAQELGIKLGNGSHKWTAWLDEAEGPDWK